MQISALKSLWWTGLFVSVGSEAAYVAIASMEVNHPEFAREFLFWPLFAFPFVPLSIRRLQHCYRLEPLANRGYLTLLDLTVASLFTGTALTIYRYVLPVPLFSMGIQISFLFGLGFFAGLIHAELTGMTSPAIRYMAALGFSLWSFAVLCLGLILPISAALALKNVDSPLEVIGSFFFPENREEFQYGFMPVLFGSLALGLIIYRIALLFFVITSDPRKKWPENLNA